MYAERYKLNLAELASDANLGLMHYASTKTRDLVEDSIECGKIFCNTIFNAIILHKKAQIADSLHQKLFSEKSDIDLNLFYFSKEFSSKLDNLNKVLEETSQARVLLDKIKRSENISPQEIDILYRYFNTYGMIVSSTLLYN